MNLAFIYLFIVKLELNFKVEVKIVVNFVKRSLVVYYVDIVKRKSI